jgi:hypothetical protein
MKRINILKYSVLIILGLILNVKNIYCQSMKEPASVYQLGNQLEYITFVTDRDLYLAGETIWFSANCLLKENHQASTLSNILYLELFNAENKSFRRDKFSLNSGQVSGSIQIPDEIPTGNYFLRVYTQYLRNFSYDACLMQWISVINPETPIPESRNLAVDSIEIVPDGMDMISNLPARVAIRIPEMILQNAETFIVEDQNQKAIREIDVLSNGLAEINFTPIDSTEYFLKVVMKSGELMRLAFPAASDAGVSILAEIEGDSLVCEIACSPKFNLVENQIQLVLIHHELDDLYETDLSAGDQKQTIRISEQYLQDGLNYIVIKDKENSIYQYKTLYLSLKKVIQIPIHLNKDSFLQRELIELDLTNSIFEPKDTAKLSVSIVKHGTHEDWNNLLPLNYIENPELITPSLLLNGEGSPDLIKQVEIAIILHKNNSSDDINNKLNKKYSPLVYLPEIRDVSISGTVRDKRAGKCASGVQVFAAVLFRNFQIHSTKTNEDGNFIFSLHNLTGIHDLFLYAGQNSDQELELFINTDFSEEYPTITDRFIPPDTSAKQLIEELWTNHQVTNIFSPETKLLAASNDLPFLFGDEMKTIRLVDYINLSTMKEVFNEIVPSVMLREADEHFHFSVFDKESEMLFRDPLLLLDHVPVLNPDDIMKIHPSQVESIGVISKVYVLGNNTYQGVISIKTRNGDFAGINFPSGSAFTEYQTITPATIFPGTVYNQNEYNDKHSPDFRTLLYWNPEFTLTSGKNYIKFNASDHSSEYDIIIRGCTKSGKYCFGKSSLKVVKDILKE